jgi:hypothetical protein
MAVTSAVQIKVTFSGDISGTEVFNDASNANSSGVSNVVALSSGNNTIAVPSAGTVPTAVTIIPPAGNTNDLILKGANGDQGIQLHDTNPLKLPLDSSVTSFVINAEATTNVRLIWS